MTAAWMLYSTAVGILLALAASGVDRALRAAGRATRWVWAGAVMASFVVPAGARFAVRGAGGVVTPANVVSPSTEFKDVATGISFDALLARTTLAVDPASAWRVLDRPLLLLGVVLSLGAAMWTLTACSRLWRARREWRPAIVESAPVLIAGRTGPAVAGVMRTAVVLPEWALTTDRALLRLMLAHEQEHVRAGDPRLLAAAAAALVLMPWNPALWYQLRRLRLAVEIDCDRRVLRQFPDVCRYGALLLEVGRRSATTRSFGPKLPLAAFGASHSSLERRIRTMTMRRPRHPVAHAIVFAAAAGALTLAACEVPHPTSVAPVDEVPLTSIRGADAAMAPGEGVSASRVAAAVREALPPEVRERRHGKLVHLWFVADADDKLLTAALQKPATGRYRLRGSTMEADPDGTTRLRSDGPMRAEAGPDQFSGLDPDAIASVEIVRFPPGRVIADSAAVVWVRLKPGAALSVRGERRTVRPVDTVRLQLRRAGPAAEPAASDEALAMLARRDSANAGNPAFNIPNGADALYILDGVILDYDGAARIHALIESGSVATVEVLKGAMARRLYGDRARNGIIEVTTKP